LVLVQHRGYFLYLLVLLLMIFKGNNKKCDSNIQIISLKNTRKFYIFINLIYHYLFEPFLSRSSIMFTILIDINDLFENTLTVTTNNIRLLSQSILKIIL
jgi:hypothetical protein